MSAVTDAAAGIAEHATVTSAGTPTNCGASVSVTEMVWVRVVALPQASVAVQVRRSWYCVAQLPDKLSCTKLTTGFAVQASPVLGVAGTGTSAQLTDTVSG